MNKSQCNSHHNTTSSLHDVDHKSHEEDNMTLLESISMTCALVQILKSVLIHHILHKDFHSNQVKHKIHKREMKDSSHKQSTKDDKISSSFVWCVVGCDETSMRSPQSSLEESGESSSQWPNNKEDKKSVVRMTSAVGYIQSRSCGHTAALVGLGMIHNKLNTQTFPLPLLMPSDYIQ